MHCTTFQCTWICTALHFTALQYALDYILLLCKYAPFFTALKYIIFYVHLMQYTHNIHSVHRPHAHWWYHWIGNGRRCAANDLDQNCRISHKNAPSRQIIMHTGENHFRDIENEHKLFAESINLNLIMEPPDILTMPRYLWFSRESHLFQDSLGVQTRCFSVF